MGLPLKTDSTFLQHEPCPTCGSSDALARYSDGHAHCFGAGCNHYEHASETETPVIKITHANMKNFQQGEYLDLVKRKISSETCRKYQYQCNDKYQIANYYNKKGELAAQKLRTPNKEFKWVGESKDIMLYGQQLFRDGGQRLIITEGEIDTLTVSQYVFQNKFPVVSIPMGVQSAKKHIANNIEWIEKFEQVIFCFDNDDVGKTAAVECAELITPNKAKICTLSLKDANEMVLQGKSKELLDTVYDSRIYRPDGIIEGSNTWDLLIQEDTHSTASYPYEGLNEKTNGIRSSEIITITAGSGIGKSQLCREIAYGLIKQDKKVAYIALEEDVRRSITGLVSLRMSLPLHKPEVKQVADTTKVREAWEFISSKVYFYDHWGSTDTDNLLNKIKYLNQSCGCNHIILDHISIVVSGIGDGDERRIIDNMMTNLRKLTQELGVSLIIVSHLKRLEGNRDHVDGVRTSLGHLRGSASIAQLSDMVIGCERNQQDEENPNVMTVRLLKNRYSGETGVACQLQYNLETGRLDELGRLQPENESGRRENHY
jgi:twinkle protein